MALTIPESDKPAVAALLQESARILRARGLSRNAYFDAGDGGHFSIGHAHEDPATRCCVIGGLALGLYGVSKDAFLPRLTLPDCQQPSEFPLQLRQAMEAVAVLGIQLESSESVRFEAVAAWSDHDGRTSEGAAAFLEDVARQLLAT